MLLSWKWCLCSWLSALPASPLSAHQTDHAGVQKMLVSDWPLLSFLVGVGCLQYALLLNRLCAIILDHLLGNNLHIFLIYCLLSIVPLCCKQAYLWYANPPSIFLENERLSWELFVLLWYLIKPLDPLLRLLHRCMDVDVGDLVLALYVLQAFGGFRRCVWILIIGLVIDSLELVEGRGVGSLVCVHLLDMILFLSWPLIYLWNYRGWRPRGFFWLVVQSCLILLLFWRSLLDGTLVGCARLANPQMRLPSICLLLDYLIFGRWRLGPVLGVGTLRYVSLCDFLIEFSATVRAFSHCTLVDLRRNFIW